MEENNQNSYETSNAPAPKAKKPVYKKWWFWLIIVIVVFALIGSLSGGGDDSKSSDDTKTTSTSQTVEAQKPEANPNAIGKYECKVVSATLCKDYAGKDAVKVKYEFVNNAEEPASFDLALNDEVYQDGVQLETAILGTDEDVDYGLDVKIKTGVTKEVTKVYVLRDTTTPLNIEVSELISLNDDKLTTTVELH